MFSYIAVGIAGTGAYMREESVLWQSAGWLVLGATPGGFAGAFTLQFLADLEVKLTLYGLVLISAIYSLYRTATDKGGKEDDDGNDAEATSDMIEWVLPWSSCLCAPLLDTIF